MLPSPIGGRRPSVLGKVFVLLVLTGCASRPGPEVLVPIAAATGSKAVPIYVATNRQRTTTSANVFTAARANSLNFARFKVSIPPNHQVGHIEWPQGAPDPRVNFVTAD